MKKRICSFLAMLIFLNLVCGYAYASEIPDLTQKGSISITMCYGENAVPGGTMTIYKVGSVVEVEGRCDYALAEDFEESGISLDNIQQASLADALHAYVMEKNLTGETKSINSLGGVTFDELELGLYLLVQQEAAEGYNAIVPFLVTVPGVLNGEYYYQIDATPKVGPITPKPSEPGSEETKPSETDPTEVETTAPVTTTPAIPVLPQTGQLNWPIPVFTVLGIFFLCGGLFLMKDKKKNEKA